METNVGLIASLFGVLGVLWSVYSTIHSAQTINRLRTSHKQIHQLELHARGEKITIDVSDLEREDPRKIERALEAVRASKAAAA